MKSFLILGIKEIKDIFISRTALLFSVLTSFIVGNSFVTAVDLYSKASKTAINNPVYATGFEPIPGIFTPTYGALFILFSIFLPFVIIPLISNERRYNTLSILTQLPFSFGNILITKFIASFLFVLFELILTLPTFVIWKLYGGHIPYTESIMLVLGYILYGIMVVAISLCMASFFKGIANAAIFSIVLIIASWVIDFAKGMNISPLISKISEYTVTKTLKYFENGIFSLRAVLYFIFISVFFLSITYIFLRFDLKNRWRQFTIIIIASIFAMISITRVNINRDVTESHRNSFSPPIAKAIKKLPNLEIDVYLRKTDSRYLDYEQTFLKKLELIRSDVKIKMITGNALEKNYGLFVYRVAGKSDKTYSNSEEEIFPLIFKLAGIKVAKENTDKNYPGYPLIVNKEKLSIIRYIYYIAIPFLLILFYIIFSREISFWRIKNEKI